MGNSMRSKWALRATAMKGRTAFFSLLIILMGSLAQGQHNQNEILSRDVLERIAGEVSGKIAFEHIRDLGIFSRWYGSDDMEKAAGYVLSKAERYGLSDICLERFNVNRDTYYWMQKPWLAWDCETAELRMHKPERQLIASYEANTPCVLVYSRDADVEAEVVYVGKGVEAAEYQGKDVKGKIVLAYGNPWAVSKIAIFEMGAAGILYGPGLDKPGLNSNNIVQTRIRPWSDDGDKRSTFGFSLSTHQARSILDYLEKGQKVVLRAVVKAEVRVPGSHVGVTATIPGTVYPEEEIILTAHLDHPRPGAHDNNSGCATLLEVARCLRILVDQKVIEPPKRTIRFFWTPHVWGAHMLFLRFPELFKKTIANINVDCVGLDQTKVSSSLTVVLPPHSRASFLGDVLENTLNYVVLCNNDSRWGRQKYGPQMIDQDGSLNVFNGRSVPFLGYSDHMFFNSGDVGIPGVMLIDLPFGSHHSQNDKLELLDPTQLKRISFLIAASAYTISAVGPEEFYRLIDEVYHKGRMRLEAELKLARSILYQAGKEQVNGYYQSVENMVRHCFKKEYQALLSTALFAGRDREAASRISQHKGELQKFEKDCLTDLLSFHRWRCEKLGATPQWPGDSPEELQFKKIIPQKNPALKGDFGSLNDYPADKYQVKDIMPDHPYYYELLNLMDGRRNMLEIIRFVQAEALSANYESLSLDQIGDYLRLLKDAGIISY